MESNESVVLTVVSGEAEAEVVCGLAALGGLRLRVSRHAGIDSPLEDFMTAGPREILVRPADLEAARALLEDSAP